MSPLANHAPHVPWQVLKFLALKGHGIAPFLSRHVPPFVSHTAFTLLQEV